MLKYAAISLAAVGLGLLLIMLQAPAEPTDYESFAKCLAASGAKMYGTDACPYCNDQKDSFGDNWGHITYIDCRHPFGGQAQACMEAGIKAYPTWEFGDGSRRLGFMNFQELSRASGCPLRESS